MMQMHTDTIVAPDLLDYASTFQARCQRAWHLILHGLCLSPFMWLLVPLLVLLHAHKLCMCLHAVCVLYPNELCICLINLPKGTVPSCSSF